VTKAIARANGGDGIHVRGGTNTVTSSDASENTGHGIHSDGSGPTIDRNRTVANGYAGSGASAVSDLVGNGILAENFSPTPPLGKNTAYANDDPAECSPASLC
jgi:parallel beta-helix repeat protein